MVPIKLGDMKRFSFPEMTSNSNGKTSATSTSGLYIILIGGICFLLGCINRMFINDSIDILSQSIIFTTVGATLLGVKNIYGGKAQTFIDEVIPQSTEPVTTTTLAPESVQINS